jgi:hypothetical protein
VKQSARTPFAPFTDELHEMQRTLRFGSIRTIASGNPEADLHGIVHASAPMVMDSAHDWVIDNGGDSGFGEPGPVAKAIAANLGWGLWDGVDCTFGDGSTRGWSPVIIGNLDPTWVQRLPHDGIDSPVVIDLINRLGMDFTLAVLQFGHDQRKAEFAQHQRRQVWWPDGSIDTVQQNGSAAQPEEVPMHDDTAYEDQFIVCCADCDEDMDTREQTQTRPDGQRVCDRCATQRSADERQERLDARAQQARITKSLNPDQQLLHGAIFDDDGERHVASVLVPVGLAVDAMAGAQMIQRVWVNPTSAILRMTENTHGVGVNAPGVYLHGDQVNHPSAKLYIAVSCENQHGIAESVNVTTLSHAQEMAREWLDGSDCGECAGSDPVKASGSVTAELLVVANGMVVWSQVFACWTPITDPDGKVTARNEWPGVPKLDGDFEAPDSRLNFTVEEAPVDAFSQRMQAVRESEASTGRRYSICTLTGQSPISEAEVKALYADYHKSQHPKLDALLDGTERTVTLNDGMCLACDPVIPPVDEATLLADDGEMFGVEQVRIPKAAPEAVLDAVRQLAPLVKSGEELHCGEGDGACIIEVQNGSTSWRERQLPVHTHDEHGYLVPKQYRSFAKGVEVWLVTITAEPTRTGVIARSVYRSERQGRGVWYYGFAAKADPTRSVVHRASDLANGILDGDYELRMPLPPEDDPQYMTAQERLDSAVEALPRSNGDPVNMSAEAQAARLQYVGLTRSNGKATTTSKQPLADESWQERHYEVDQTGTTPEWTGTPCALCHVPMQPGDAEVQQYGKGHAHVACVTDELEVPCDHACDTCVSTYVEYQEVVGELAQAGVLDQKLDLPAYIASLKEQLLRTQSALETERRSAAAYKQMADASRAEFHALQNQLDAEPKGSGAYPDSVVALVEALHEWFSVDNAARLSGSALLFDDDHSLAEHVASCHEQLQNGSLPPLAELHRDLTKLDWELLAMHREHEHANGYRLTYTVLARRLTPVFPEAPYVVSSWSGGDTLPSGFGSSRYDLTIERARLVYAEETGQL